MSLKKITGHGHGSLTELNITPLLDLVFVLLVIFIFTTPKMRNNLEMTLPPGKPPPPKLDEPKPKIHRLRVDAEGHSYLDEQLFAAAELKNQLQPFKSADAAFRGG